MDILRILSSVLVLISHLRIFQNTGLSSELLSAGAIGVDFFFILSGYSMAAMFEKNSHKPAWPARFLLNRFIRVCLPYFVALFAYIYISKKTFTSSEVVKSFLFLNNNNTDYSVYGLPILPPGWSINYEVLFYASLFVSEFFRRGYTLPLVFISAVYTSIFVPQSYIMLELLFGYYIWIYRKQLISLRINRITSLAIILLSAIFIVYNKNLAGDFISPDRILSWGIPSSLLFILILNKSRESGLLYRLKKYNFSFSLYLTHWIVLTWYTEEHRTSLLVLYSALIGVTALFYLCIERPAHDLSKHLTQ